MFCIFFIGISTIFAMCNNFVKAKEVYYCAFSKVYNFFSKILTLLLQRDKHSSIFYSILIFHYLCEYQDIYLLR